jgi:hypothetical protein
VGRAVEVGKAAAVGLDPWVERALDVGRHLGQAGVSAEALEQIAGEPPEAMRLVAPAEIELEHRIGGVAHGRALSITVANARADHHGGEHLEQVLVGERRDVE